MNEQQNDPKEAGSVSNVNPGSQPEMNSFQENTEPDSDTSTVHDSGQNRRKVFGLNLISGGLIAITIALYGIMFWNDLKTSAAKVDLVYYVLVFVLILGARVGATVVIGYPIWRWVFKRRKGWSLFVYSLILCVSTLVFFQTDLQENRQRTAFMEDMQTVQRRVVNGDSIPFERNDRERYGQYAGVMDNLIDFVNENHALKDGLDEQMENIHLEALFSDETFNSKANITAAQEDLRRLNQIHDRYVQVYRERGKKLELLLSQMDISSQMKDFFERFKESTQNSITITIEMVNYEKQVSAEMDEFLEFLKERMGTYTFVDGKFNFVDAADQERYQEFITTLRGIQEAQFALLANLQVKL